MISWYLCNHRLGTNELMSQFACVQDPHVDLKLEDFTLTRIPRPKAIYTNPKDTSASMKVRK